MYVIPTTCPNSSKNIGPGHLEPFCQVGLETKVIIVYLYWQWRLVLEPVIATAVDTLPITGVYLTTLHASKYSPAKRNVLKFSAIFILYIYYRSHFW